MISGDEASRVAAKMRDDEDDNQNEESETRVTDENAEAAKHAPEASAERVGGQHHRRGRRGIDLRGQRGSERIIHLGKRKTRAK